MDPDTDALWWWALRDTIEELHSRHVSLRELRDEIDTILDEVYDKELP